MSRESLVFPRVGVVGAGTMGAGIAQVCAQSGSSVILHDVTQAALDLGMQTIQNFLSKGVSKGKLTPVQKSETVSRVKLTTDLGFLAKESDLVIEAVPEKLELKLELFGRVAADCGAETVLASNTSSLSLADVFAGIPGPERCCGMHFFNPPPIMKLLEVIRPEAASVGTLDKVLEYSRQIGKEPILVKDSPGFATSRLGVVLGLEAIRMVESGVAEPEDIDKAMELGYRHPMGPLRLTDLVGLDVRMAIADYLRERLDSPAFDVPPMMREMVKGGRLGKKSGQGFYTWE